MNTRPIRNAIPKRHEQSTVMMCGDSALQRIRYAIQLASTASLLDLHNYLSTRGAISYPLVDVVGHHFKFIGDTSYKKPFVMSQVLNMSGAEAGLAAWVETSGRSMGHLLDLGTRLGTFFPPAEGPGGPPPGVDALFAGAVGALRTVTRDPPAPWYDATKIVGDLTGHQDDEGEGSFSPSP